MALAFQDFQRELVRLHSSGVLIVLCTNNDPEYALAAFDHPSMVLRREHVVAERVNWQDKATNLRELAEELDLGLHSFVFLDDNPREREWIRQALPMVTVPELPADPTGRPRSSPAGRGSARWRSPTPTARAPPATARRATGAAPRRPPSRSRTTWRRSSSGS